MAAKGKDEERKFILECIEVYRSLPALWDIKSKDYSNRIKKNEQYEQLLRKYREYYPDADKSQLVKKFNSLRTNFRKELNRIKYSEKSGAGTDDITEPTLWYFDEMKFLVGQYEPSTSQNTMQIEDDDKEAEDGIDDVDSNGTMNTSTISVSKYNLFIHIYILCKFMLPRNLPFIIKEIAITISDSFRNCG